MVPMDLLSLDDRGEEHALSRRDGRYVVLREEGDELIGLTVRGAVHRIALRHGRPVLVQNLRSSHPQNLRSRQEEIRLEAGWAVRASDGARIALPATTKATNNNSSSNTKKEEEEEEDGAKGAVLLGSDAVLLRDGRVVALRWSGLSVSELSPALRPRGRQQREEPEQEQEQLAARWGHASMLVRAGEERGTLSLLWTAPLLRSDGRCGSGFVDSGGRVWFVGEEMRSCCFGAAVTASGALVTGRKRVAGEFVSVSRSLEGRIVATDKNGHEHVVSEGEPGGAEGVWLDEKTWSMRSKDGQELWGDNSELDWWPLTVAKGECVALLLSRPLRIARHPLPSSSSGWTGAVAAARAAQLSLHRAVLSKKESASLQCIDDSALSLLCAASVARRLDPPLWPRLLPNPEQSFHRALALSPRLAALLLPVALHPLQESENGFSDSALAALLLAEQLRLGLLADARDTLRFAFAGRVDNSPTLAAHCRSLALHRRPLGLLRLAKLLSVPSSLSCCVAAVLASSFCAAWPGRDQPENDLWELVEVLQDQLGLRGPVASGETLVMVNMSGHTRQLLELFLVDAVVPLFRCAAALLLLKLRDARDAGDILRDAASSAPREWSVAVSMCIGK